MGGKRIKLDSKLQPNKFAKRCSGGVDRLSLLSDDLLLNIVSSLPLKEVARTSILSSRWINLWKHTLSLDFDAASAMHKFAKRNMFCKIAKRKELLEIERTKYLNWVNRVLQSHKSPTLTQFRICFDLDKSSQNTIKRCLEFALARQVQGLELDLLNYNGFGRSTSTRCVFPRELLVSRNINSLKTLSLKCVNVTSEAIELLLRDCPLLEKLSVRFTDVLNLRVRGASLVLKHLEVLNCNDLKTLEVSAPNLTSLGVMILDGLVLENVPKLVEVSVTCGTYNNPVSSLLRALSCCILQLEILNLQLLRQTKESIEDVKFPQLPKLKKFFVEYWTEADESFISLTSLIRAAPYLEEFVLEIHSNNLARKKRDLKDSMRFPHNHLKVVKFCYYYGRSSDLEFVKYIWENCAVLEKIIIDTHTPNIPDNLVAEQTAKKHANRQLEARVPKHIELVIL